jgi:phospholipase/carboxylesterase
VLPVVAPHREGLPPAQRTVVALHGHGGQPWAAATCAALLDPLAAVLAPQGPLRTGEGWSWFDPSGDAPGGVSLRGSLVELEGTVAAQQAAYELAGGAVYYGFSQGGALALAAALQAWPTVAAVVALAAFLPDPDRFDLVLEQEAPPPVFLWHGEHDSMVDPMLGRSAARLLERKGWDVTFVEHPAGHQVTLGALEAAAAWLAEHDPPA